MDHVLLIDDDPITLEALAAGLAPDRYRVTSCTSGGEGLEAAGHGVDVVVTDLRMRGMDGLELCERMRARHPDVPVIVMTAFREVEAAVAAIRAGAYDFLLKPFEIETLEIALDRALDHRRLTQEVRTLKEQLDRSTSFEEIIGESRAILELTDLLRRVAPVESAVLITGETGTGKELVARALHQKSPRSRGQFVAVNCAAVPETLLESELFGHERGAFTGAERVREGLFQKARGGTIFLDEIGDMPLAIQAKLLRVLQERRVRPIGGANEVEIDVRVLSATHRDLEREVQQSHFRRDLLFRINVIQLDVPPLRERENDVLLLAQHFVERFAERSSRPVRGLSPPVAEKLLAYDWPGNVRELSNAIERAVVLTRPEQLVVDDLPPQIRGARPIAPDPTAGEGLGGFLPLEQVERRYILRVLEAVGGNKAHAARILGVGRKTLYRRLEQWEASRRESA